MLCQFTTTETPNILHCPVCNRTQRSKYGPEKTFRECRKECDEPKTQSLWQQLRSGLLGDVTEQILSSVGLTKERWQEIIGGPCGCGERQAWLNKVGAAIMNKPTPREK